MKRYRLVTASSRSATEHVSSVLLAESEVDEHLELEASLHAAFGWLVTRGERMVVCTHNDTTRVITVRESDPMDDALPHQENT